MTGTIRGIEIEFDADVNFPDGFERALSSLVSMVCEQYQRENPTRVMWAAEHGSKPLWSQADAVFLGRKPGPNAPANGEPSFNDSVFMICCAEREDYYGTNPHNPNREALQRQSRSQHKAVERPVAKGVTRDAENPRALVVVFDREPTDDDLLALHKGLR